MYDNSMQTSAWESIFCLILATDGFAAAFLGVAAAPLTGVPVWVQYTQGRKK